MAETSQVQQQQQQPQEEIDTKLYPAQEIQTDIVARFRQAVFSSLNRVSQKGQRYLVVEKAVPDSIIDEIEKSGYTITRTQHVVVVEW